jgi:hypothetical protein
MRTPKIKTLLPLLNLLLLSHLFILFNKSIKFVAFPFDHDYFQNFLQRKGPNEPVKVRFLFIINPLNIL